MKIALVHDHLAQDGGAENVLEVFCEMWPNAPIHVLVHDPKNANPYFADKDIRTSFIQRLPLGVKKYQWYFPMMPAAIESFDLSEYDVVISTSSSFAKGVVTRPGTMHISYCHTPTRFLWSDTHSYVEELGVNSFLKRIIPIFLSNVRIWDRIAAERVDHYIANSLAVQKRIQKYYHQESTLMYPPVDVADFQIVPKDQVGDFFLAGGRLVPYKRFDLLIDAFNKLGKPLKIFGNGPAMADLQRRAGSNVEFLGRISDEELRRLYSTCAAFLNPQEEDFGITMIEAMASGRPVIAYNKGGATEIVEDGISGKLVDYQTWEDFADALIGFDPMAFDPEQVRARALTFRVDQFTTTMRQFVEDRWEEFQRRNT
ncbi:MAG: glycosyltransferase family 4 protein [Candidatus Kerfeldbacteria bacterium CG15_BIG_FIL_POST_REV_8_21_14_020_45_12]|uniref:Glycosyltransferase family 4 protein n=1 Tax=Candidatus Kerfeldbacteria bacterium CG15_BIG_FIL_POST_REV_8_21_14_020_45_12 TaxID=2014247 RepID=A0A2M7H271_9BACT|nr:MAG: glycosyltransferase family 4 protein [Candidatus Kerfeldbacteria bacterium CG15_BIG_FIL_POST_REV_8_21_14_020_45_12]PJA92976.1 MAG: glycosyltransferase family 4 protein [Candidatus Kerfeldbacteria bacterium CG_4_9_14_3_um_filter_45_8]